jgi:hypothetical protein
MAVPGAQPAGTPVPPMITNHNLHYKFQAAFATAVDLADFEFYTVPTEQ